MKIDPLYMILGALCEALEQLLYPHGFRRVGTPFSIGKYEFRAWERDFNWKVEIVEISYPTNQPDCVRGHVKIRLPVPGDERCYLDGTTVSYHASGTDRSYAFPELFAYRSIAIRKYVQRIADDTEAALSWFQLYETPKDCMARIESGKTNTVGDTRGGAYEVRMTYLRSLG